MYPMYQIGYDNYIFPRQVAIILNAHFNEPVKKLVRKAKKENKLFNTTQGKKTQSIIVLKSGELIQSMIRSVTIKNRYIDDIARLNSMNDGRLLYEPLLHLGFNNFLHPENIKAVLNYNTHSVKKLVWTAKEEGTLIDITKKKRMESVLVLNSGQLVLTSKSPKVIKNRYNNYLQVNNTNSIEEENNEFGDDEDV
ncbi:MAG: DUF370 domain-containing protein [Candidatus Woesearchaeota archaeon]